FMNRAGAQILGYAPGEVLGQDMHQLIHHSYDDGSPYPESQCPIYKVLREGVGCRLSEEVLWRKDGTSFPAEYSSFPIIHDGRLQGAVVTVTDITGRKLAERELRQAKEAAEAANRDKDQLLASVRESEEPFRTLAKATNDAVWDWALLTNKVWWNEGVLTLFGYRLDHSETDLAWWLERVHPEDRAAVESFFLKMVRGKELTWVDEYRF